MVVEHIVGAPAHHHAGLLGRVLDDLAAFQLLFLPHGLGHGQAQGKVTDVIRVVAQVFSVGGSHGIPSQFCKICKKFTPIPREKQCAEKIYSFVTVIVLCLLRKE